MFIAERLNKDIVYIIFDMEGIVFLFVIDLYLVNGQMLNDAESNTNINLTKDAPPDLTDSLLRNSSVSHTTDSEDESNRVSDGTDTRLVVGASIGAFLLILVVTGLIAASRRSKKARPGFQATHSMMYSVTVTPDFIQILRESMGDSRGHSLRNSNRGPVDVSMSGGGLHNDATRSEMSSSPYLEQSDTLTSSSKKSNLPTYEEAISSIREEVTPPPYSE